MIKKKKVQTLELEHEGKTYVSAFTAWQILGISQTIWYRNEIEKSLPEYKFPGTYGRKFYLLDDIQKLKDEK